MDPNKYIEKGTFGIQASLIFEMKDTFLHIKKGGYVQHLLKAFSDNFPGVYNIKDFHTHLNGNLVTFRVYCAQISGAANPESSNDQYCKKKWILKCKKNVPIESKVMVQVFEENRECLHAEHVHLRPLRITGLFQLHETKH